MKTQEHRLADLRHIRLEADLEAGIQALFGRCPTLCGFAVQELESPFADGPALQDVSELYVTEISIYPFSGLRAPKQLTREIVAALGELIDERPEAGELLRGRTFARAFH